MCSRRLERRARKTGAGTHYAKIDFQGASAVARVFHPYNKALIYVTGGGAFVTRIGDMNAAYFASDESGDYDKDCAPATTGRLASLADRELSML